MSVPQPPVYAQPFADIPPWPPQRWTEPLAPEFPSAFDSYRDLFRIVWMNAFGYTLELWQETLLRHVFELYPAGHKRAGQLRWRQVVVSLGRQNGKTEIACAVALIVLLMKARPLLIGIASTVDQANLIYQRTMFIINQNPRLKAKFAATTRTRGIRTLDGGSYELKANKSGALQGIPLDAGLVDELHLLLRDVWDDLVNGLGGRPNSFVFGITTAGNDDSALLLSLYDKGAESIKSGGASRVAFFCWEARNALMPDDDEELGRELARANPGVACGRIDLETSIEDVRSMPEPGAIRYRLNRFTGSENVFISGAMWNACQVDMPWPADATPVFVVDRTPDWSYASIGAFAKLEDGRIYCDLVASFVRPTLEQLIDACVTLAKWSPATYGIDGYALRDLGRALEERGLPVTFGTQADALNGSALLYSKVQQKLIVHPGHPLLAMQMPKAVRKDVGDGFRVSRAKSGQIDAVMTHVQGVLLADVQRDTRLQIF